MKIFGYLGLLAVATALSVAFSGASLAANADYSVYDSPALYSPLDLTVPSTAVESIDVIDVAFLDSCANGTAPAGWLNPGGYCEQAASLKSLSDTYKVPEPVCEEPPAESFSFIVVPEDEPECPVDDA